jgi:hypothetical protein
VNRDSGTASANGGWLRRLVSPRRFGVNLMFHNYDQSIEDPCQTCPFISDQAIIGPILFLVCLNIKVRIQHVMPTSNAAMKRWKTK